MDRHNQSAHRAATTLVLCAVAAALEGFDNQAMGVAAPQLVPQFGLSAAQASYIFSAATFGLFLGAVIGGRAADRFGRKRILVLSLFLCGLCSLLTATASGMGMLFTARLLTGLGLGGAMPNFIALASESAHPQRRLSAVTIVMAGLPLGGALAGGMTLGDALQLGWRGVFYLGGAAPILLALLMLPLLPATPHPGGMAASAPVAGGRIATAPQPPATRLDGALAVLFGSGRAATTLLLWSGFFFTQLVLLLLLNWLPSLFVGLGFGRVQASWISVGFNLGGAVGASLLGRLHAGRHRRLWVTITYLGMAVALAAMTQVGRSFADALAAGVLAGGFIIGAQLVLFALAPLYYSTRSRGTGVGAAVAIGRLGSIAGPLYAGALLARGGGSATVLLGILPFVAIAGIAALALTRRPQGQDQDQAPQPPRAPADERSSIPAIPAGGA